MVCLLLIPSIILNSFLLPVYVHMCLHVCVCACVYTDTSAYVHMCTWKSEVDFGSLPKFLFSYFLEQAILLNLQMTDSGIHLPQPH